MTTKGATAVFSRTSLGPTTAHPLARAIDEARSGPRALVDLTISNPTICGLLVDGDDEILRAIAAPAALRYDPDPLGMPKARAAAAASFPAPWRPRPERMLLTASTSEAYGYLFKLLCDPGDEILIPEPGYPLLEHLARFERIALRPYRLGYDGSWHLDRSSVEMAMGPRTRALVIVSPNNPTGNVISDEELDFLGGLGLPIIADEVFGRYPLSTDASHCASALRNAPVLTFSLGGLSKLCGLPQLKLAWIAVAGRDALVSEAMSRLEFIADAYLSVGSPIQCALPRVLEYGEHVSERVSRRVRDGLKVVRARLAGSECTVLHVDAGWYVTVRLPAVLSEDEWCLSLLRERGIVVQPGWLYDFPFEPLIVLSLLTPPEILEPAVVGLREHVARACR